jgi:hypothetical protein
VRSEQIITESGTTVGFYDASDTLEPLRNAQIGDGDDISKATFWDELKTQADKAAAASNKRAENQATRSKKTAKKIKAAQKAGESPILSTVKAAISQHAPKTPTGRVAAVTVPLAIGGGVLASGRSPRDIASAGNQQIRTKLAAGKEQAQEKYAESRDTRRYRPASLYYDDALGKALEDSDNIVDEIAKGLLNDKTARLGRKAMRLESRTDAKRALAAAKARAGGIEPSKSKDNVEEARRILSLMPQSKEGKIALAAGVPATVYALNKSDVEKGFGEVLRGGRWIARVPKVHPTAAAPAPLRSKATQAERNAYNRANKAASRSATTMRDAQGRKIYVDNARPTRPHPTIADTEEEFLKRPRKAILADEISGMNATSAGQALAGVTALGTAGAATVKGVRAALRGRSESKALKAAEKAAADAKAKRLRQVNTALTAAGISLPVALGAKMASDRYAKSGDVMTPEELEEITKIAIPTFARKRLVERHVKRAQKFSDKAQNSTLQADQTRFAAKSQKSAGKAAKRAGLITPTAGAAPAATGAGGVPGAARTPITGVGDWIADITRTTRNARGISDDVREMMNLKQKPMFTRGQKIALGGAGVGGLMIGRNLAGPKPYPYQQQQA